PGRAAVPAERIARVTAADLGAGPWGQDASPTWVGPVKVMAIDRARRRWPELPLTEQIDAALAMVVERGAFDAAPDSIGDIEVRATNPHAPRVAVVLEPGRAHSNRELLGAAAALTGNVLAIALEPPDPEQLSAWGASGIVHLDGENVEEDVAEAVTEVAREG